MLRTTQFHDLVVRLLKGLAKLAGRAAAGRVADQPIEVAEVAARLAELAAGAPAGRVEDMGGPEIRTFESLARAYLRATGRRRAVLNVPLRGKAYRAFAAEGTSRRNAPWERGRSRSTWPGGADSRRDRLRAGGVWPLAVRVPGSADESLPGDCEHAPRTALEVRQLPLERHRSR